MALKPAIKKTAHAGKPSHAPKQKSDFSLVSSFPLGYRNREDVTNLPAGVLVKGSQNVLTNTSGRVGLRKGYTLDGQSSTVLGGIKSTFDWPTHLGPVRHLRSGSLTSAANDGKLQYRYLATGGEVWSGHTFSAGQIYWIDLMTSLTSVSFNFTDWWDTTNLQAVLLFVNGASEINEWTGGITTLASTTVNTITKSGTKTWAEEGFYTTGTHSVMINGNSYQATAGWGTLTLTGVGTDPTGEVVNSLIHQKVKTTANSAMTNLPSIANSLIANLRNQIYVSSFVNNSVSVSKVNNYTDYSFATPRVVGEGALLTLDGTPNALIPQEDAMYISAGLDQWYQTQFTVSSDNTKEALTISRLKTTSLQAAQSQALTVKMGNSVVFLSHEPIVQSLGRVQDVILTPQLTDLSFPIVNDVNAYDFTGGRLFYFQKFVYLSAPAEGKTLVYNMTNEQINSNGSKNHYWEAPQILPVGQFSIIDGALYGHDNNVPQSYKLFDGLNDNGHPIEAWAKFSYNNYGTRSNSKGFNEYYVEGYIAQNTTLDLGITYEIDGFATSTKYPILGTDTQIVAITQSNASIGKVSLGKNPLGSTSNETSPTDLPPKFREIQTFPIDYFYEEQTTFHSTGKDFQWEILAFGPKILPYGDLNNSITK